MTIRSNMIHFTHMKETLNLKFPTGPFTHSMLAEHNGLKNTQVWQAYQQAIKDGVIVFVGLRGGKGKPSKLWQLNGPGVVAITDTTKVVQNISAPKTPNLNPKPDGGVVEIGNAILNIPHENTPKPEKVEVKTTSISAIPTNALVAAITSEPDVDLDNEPDEFVPTPEWAKKPASVEPNNRGTEFNCPICGNKCIAWDVSNGVFVQCNQTNEVCKRHENPYGFGRNEKAAFTILCEKYGKHQ